MHLKDAYFFSFGNRFTHCQSCHIGVILQFCFPLLFSAPQEFTKSLAPAMTICRLLGIHFCPLVYISLNFQIPLPLCGIYTLSGTICASWGLTSVYTILSYPIMTSVLGSCCDTIWGKYSFHHKSSVIRILFLAFSNKDRTLASDF